MGRDYDSRENTSLIFLKGNNTLRPTTYDTNQRDPETLNFRDNVDTQGSPKFHVEEIDRSVITKVLHCSCFLWRRKTKYE